jgi:hypothetical protein
MGDSLTIVDEWLQLESEAVGNGKKFSKQTYLKKTTNKYSND